MRVVVFDLAAQAVDVDLQHVALAEVFRPPDVLQQQVLRDDAPGVLRQIGEDADTRSASAGSRSRAR